jgi:putative ABC transport system permease protein
MVLERRREMATLQALGARDARLYFSLVQEAFLLALASLLLAAPGSFMFAQILIRVINRFSFGWTIETAYPLVMLLGTGVVVLTASIFAALAPVYIIRRQNVAAAIRAEDYN